MIDFNDSLDNFLVFSIELLTFVEENKTLRAVKFCEVGVLNV